jgi:hypothetical protein
MVLYLHYTCVSSLTYLRVAMGDGRVEGTEAAGRLGVARITNSTEAVAVLRGVDGGGGGGGGSGMSACDCVDEAPGDPICRHSDWSDVPAAGAACRLRSISRAMACRCRCAYRCGNLRQNANRGVV